MILKVDSSPKSVRGKHRRNPPSSRFTLSLDGTKCLAILILLNSTSFVHVNHLSICEKFLIITKLFCVAVDTPRYPTRILLPLSKICYERIRAFYYTLPWNTIISQCLVGTSLRTTTSHYQDRHKVICICFSRC